MLYFRSSARIWWCTVTRPLSSSPILELCFQEYRKGSVGSVGGPGARSCLFGSQDSNFQVKAKVGSKVRLPWQRGPVHILLLGKIRRFLFYFKIPGEAMEDLIGESNVIRLIYELVTLILLWSNTLQWQERNCHSGHGLHWRVSIGCCLNAANGTVLNLRAGKAIRKSS